MLGKLIKYDLKYGYRIFLLMHIILLCSCILGRIIFMNKVDFSMEASTLFSSMILFISLYTLLFTSISFGLTALVTIRFYKNLFTDEGYLSWTIPATATQQLWAKIISGYIWHILSFLLMAVSLLILVTGDNVVAAYSEVAHEVTNTLGMPLGRFGLLWYVFCTLSTIGNVILVYLCIAIGQLFPGHRILCAIVSYFILSAITQIITFVILTVSNLYPASSPYAMPTGADALQHTYTLFSLTGVLSLIITILSYIGLHFILNKKINLS